MANSLNIDLTGKYVILKANCYMGNEMQRLYLCESGFGCYSETRGSAIFGYFVSDNEQCRVEGYEVERLATEDEIKQAKSQ